jgi:hypothetical protein
VRKFRRRAFIQNSHSNAKPVIAGSCYRNRVGSVILYKVKVPSKCTTFSFYSPAPMITGSSHHESSSPPLPTTNLTNSKSANPTSFHAGAPQRKKRSGCKSCLWLLGIGVVLGGFGAFFYLKNFFYVFLHPHRDMYFDENGPEFVDWSQIVRPMVQKDSKFDVVASVWVRDDDLVEGEDAVLKIDGEVRSEKLLFTRRVFRNVSVNDETKFANVELQVPTHHLQVTFY